MHPLQHGPGPDTERIVPSLNLEASRGCSTDRLLQWPIFDKLLYSLPRFRFLDPNGHEVLTYLDDVVRQTDYPLAHLSPTSGSGSVIISTNRLDIQQLVDSFFQRVNIKNPILTRQEVEEYCHQYYENGPRFNLETGLVLLVCALGAVADEFNPLDMGQSPGSSFDTPSRLERLKLGNCYFAASEKRLGAAISRVDTLSIQCLCLAGPVQALRMFHAAGSSLQILLSTSIRLEALHSSSRASFGYVLNQKGIPALRDPPSQDSYPPPQHVARDDSNKWASSEEDSWFFLLSEIALRRITDQVTEIVTKYIDSKIHYQQSQSIEGLVPIVAEFEDQVETFQQLLPEAIRFHDVPQPASTEWQQYSRGRYYRLLELMHRPFVFTAIHEPSCSPAVQVLAKKGLENGLKYLQHSQANQRHHGLWLQLRNQLRIASFLLAASTIPHITMPEGWYGGISKTLATLDYWSFEFPSCKSYTDVILALSAPSSGSAEERSPMSY
ncbi:C6 zinc finger domain-containing protein [Fusarium pseudocircinatum]|uniref:C6 zinc finger domain-containing protein n=1 Tax=Fusarium pseudocircinatum TaxID=56676 RepID=A0A8H5KQ09_9HYPO|nr:C6 zinc finger domain-containing protein [Fusarium pseudocircinatum]